MQIEIKKCGSCNIETNKGKHWGTGAWLCEKCYNEWNEEDKKMRSSSSNESVSESIVRKIKKGRNKKRRNLKIVKTKLHKNGVQSRLNIS